jgi:hypothetical protein
MSFGKAYAFVEEKQAHHFYDEDLCDEVYDVCPFTDVYPDSTINTPNGNEETETFLFLQTYGGGATTIINGERLQGEGGIIVKYSVERGVEYHYVHRCLGEKYKVYPMNTTTIYFFNEDKQEINECLVWRHKETPKYIRIIQ